MRRECRRAAVDKREPRRDDRRRRWRSSRSRRLRVGGWGREPAQAKSADGTRLHNLQQHAELPHGLRPARGYERRWRARAKAALLSETPNAAAWRAASRQSRPVPSDAYRPQGAGSDAHVVRWTGCRGAGGGPGLACTAPAPANRRQPAGLAAADEPRRAFNTKSTMRAIAATNITMVQKNIVPTTNAPRVTSATASHGEFLLAANKPAATSTAPAKRMTAARIGCASLGPNAAS